MVRARSDILFLESFTNVFKRNFTSWVPYAMMHINKARRYKHTDHLYVCPRHLCERYFLNPMKQHKECKIPSFSVDHLLPQSLFVNQFAPVELSTMYVFYS